jgi:N-acetyl-gamma-glutamylphosphate reductase
MHRKAIAGAGLVAVPGYPAGAILAAAPLLPGLAWPTAS